MSQATTRAWQAAHPAAVARHRATARAKAQAAAPVGGYQRWCCCRCRATWDQWQAEPPTGGVALGLCYPCAVAALDHGAVGR